MGTKLQARIMHSLAQNDQFDGVGRLFLREAREATGNPSLSVDDILEYWKEYYEAETAEQQQPNLILIWFHGKPKLERRKPVGKLTAGTSTLVFAADKTNIYQAEPPETYEGTYFKAENPEDRIIL